MSDSRQTCTLCERCSLLSFDDLAIGGQEEVGEDGVARLSFPDSIIEFRPLDWGEDRESRNHPPQYRLVPLDWWLYDTLPNMPILLRSSQLGCAFCRALHGSLEEMLAEEANKGPPLIAGTLDLVAYLSLADEIMEGLVVEVTSDQTNFGYGWEAAHIMFPLEAASSKL